jgi:alpha-L-rhamnosidase
LLLALVFSMKTVRGSVEPVSPVQLVDLRCEYRTAPLGVDIKTPCLSWRMESDEPGQKQMAYRILVADSPEKLTGEKGNLWGSGRVVSDRSQHIVYAGQPLVSKTAYFWKVRVWDQSGKATAWSEPAYWGMGYLSPDDWTAKWIKAPEPQAPEPEDIQIIEAIYGDDNTSMDVTQRLKEMVSRKQKIIVNSYTFKQDKAARNYVLNVDYELKGEPMSLVVNPKHTVDFSGESAKGKAAPHFRKKFSLPAVAERAGITVNAAAFFELYVNGSKVGTDVLTPAQSATQKRTFSVTYDVQPYLKKGENCIGLWVGHWQGPFANPVVVRAQLDAVVNGKQMTLGTDASWLTRNSGRYTIQSDKFGGERVDARELVSGWSQAGTSTDGWREAVETSGFPGKVLNQPCPLNRLGEPIPPVSIAKIDNSYEIDFGTNLTGWFRMKMPQLTAGDRIKMTFADSKGSEKQKGEGYQSFGQTGEFISAGQSGEVFQHQFNYAAFRYVIVQNLPEAPKKSDASAMLIDSDLAITGGFECSNELLNRIFDLNEWTQRCLNLGGYWVDCPHRERKGYGGDGQTPVEGFLTSFRADGFYRKWLMDWKDVQKADGSLPNTAPQGFGGGGPAWGGFVAAVTWRHYLYYGDQRVLEENYETVRSYIEHLEAVSAENGDILTGKTGKFSFIGDWVAPGRGMNSKNMPCHEARKIFNNCYRIYHMQLYIKIAAVLGKDAEAAKYKQVIERIRPLIHEKFYDEETGAYVYDQQAYYILPLMTGVVPEALRAKVLKDLEKNILVTRDGHLDTGLLGTYFMLEYLREIGRSDLLFTIFNQTTYPGWGYMLEQGATTVWEQWDGFFSHIHSCFPSANNWLYQGLGGIQADPNVPGFKNVIIKPDLVGDVTWVKAHHDSPYGRIESIWKHEGGKLDMEVAVPPNSTATVYVPAETVGQVSVNGRKVDQATNVNLVGMENERVVLSVGSGRYMILTR